MGARPVVLSAPQAEWAVVFEREARLLSRVLGDVLLEIHHVGSTAVPSLFAKPIVDVMPVVTHLSFVDPLRRAFEAEGYLWKGEHGIAGRRYIVRERADALDDLVHIHVLERHHFEVDRHLAFRDFLRANPTVVEEYSELKVTLAGQFRDDRPRYQEAKGEFIEAVLKRAMGDRYVDARGATKY